ncbi:MAG: uracil-DNA glycosylase family protein [Prevotella sp.]|jgi:hypothetical protein|nr:uracil-DNA glycosylase family protein [Prevotella sp.]MCH4211387.1 uracil-DNA glycosylase family protein [Prevotella sp.]MCH4240452.1 uracil-DNA glycosylase family protein [Prevotella sp.]
MGKYNEKLDSIFKEWIEKSEKNGEARENYDNHYNSIIFTSDGLMEKPNSNVEKLEKDWENENIRVMFLLKDQPSKDRNDARKWLIDKEKGAGNSDLKPKFIHNIANLFYGIYHSRIGSVVSFESLDKEEVKKTFLTKPFAFVECKKQGGETSISDDKLNQYLNNKDYKPLLEKEIKVLNPNVIVCTNKNIYKFIIDMYGGENAFLSIPNHNSIRIRPEKDGKSKLIILLTYHPSAIQSYETFFEGAMDHYRAFLNSEIAFDL